MVAVTSTTYMREKTIGYKNIGTSPMNSPVAYSLIIIEQSGLIIGEGQIKVNMASL